MDRWFRDIPLVTRAWTIVCLITALAIQFKYITQYQLYFHPLLVIYKFQIWRVVTSFVYFGGFGIEFLFHMHFLIRHCRLLEEDVFRNKRADFVFMLIFSMFFLLVLGALAGIPFLGSSLVIALVYIWSRKNPFLMLNFLGLFTFSASYLPWVLLAIQLLLSNQLPFADVAGIAVGHLYYYFHDIYPLTHTGARILTTPRLLQLLVGE